MTIATVELDAGAGLADLAAALREAVRQPAVRAVLVTCTGDALAPAEVPEGASAADTAARAVQQALARAQAPSVLAVAGPVSGAGLAAMLHFDVTLSGPRSTFTAGDPAGGAFLCGGLPGLLTRRLGAARARQLALTGQLLPAGLALDWGLIAGVDPHCADRAAELVRSWAQSPGAGLALRALHAAERLDPAGAAAYARDLLPLLDAGGD